MGRKRESGWQMGSDKAMKTFFFTVELSGQGDTPEDAWDHAVEAFAVEPGPCPDEFSVDDEDDFDLPETV